MITKYKTYTNDRSDLALKVLNIYYVGDSYIKVKGTLFNKKNGIEYETKQFKLFYRLIEDWYEISCN